MGEGEEPKVVKPPTGEPASSPQAAAAPPPQAPEPPAAENRPVEAPPPPPAPPTPPPAPAKPKSIIRSLTVFVLLLALGIFVYGLFAERYTPYTDQATVQAYLVTLAPD